MKSKPMRHHPKKLAMAEAYRHAQTLTAASQAANVKLSTHHNWMNTDEEYRNIINMIDEIKCEELLAEAVRRAKEGDKHYKFDKKGAPLIHPITGEPYYETQRSDYLLNKLLCWKVPGFSARTNHHRLTHDGDMQVNVKKVILEDSSSKQEEADKDNEPEQ